jgi:hypothetical protein
MELSTYDLMDPRDLPVPQDRPFSTAEAFALGVTRHRLGEYVRHGLLVSPIKGVHHVPHLADSLDLRVACVRLVAPPDAVVCDQTAGWLHDAPMVLAPDAHVVVPKVDLYVPQGRRVRHGLAESGERTFLPRDLVEIGGLVVTSPLRTACDLGRLRHRDLAFASLDAMLRTGKVTRSELVAEANSSRYKGYRHIRQLRELAPDADPGAESMGESVLRRRWLDCGDLPRPELQVPVQGPDGECFLDLGLPGWRYGAEYDGEEWHDAPEQRRHDARRRDGIRRMSGYVVDVLRKSNVFGARQDAELVLRAGVRDACERSRSWIA